MASHLTNLLAFCLVCLNVSTILGFHSGHRVACDYTKQCNGNLMCAYTCVRGSVVVDEWALQSLAYQRKLQLPQKFLYQQFPSSHNSAVSEAEGFGIEKYFISALQGGTDLDTGDDLGEGVCQYLSLTDQLRMGVRHVEVDIWWDPIKNDVIMCHTPVPVYPYVHNITKTAEAANITLEFDAKKMSCIGTQRDFTDVLKEVRDWMILPENSQEFVIIYLDTKFYLNPEQVTKANNEIKAIFGEMLWSASAGSPFQQTMTQLLSANKRILIENAKECWSKPLEGEQVVFYPTLWNHQFSASDMAEFPDCSVQGDSQWYGTEQVRALDGTFIEAAARCGVQIASADYINPDDMKYYVWSWDQLQPSNKEGCVAQLPSGRWATLSCDEQLPFACLNSASQESGAYTEWTIDLNTKGSRASATCPEGTVFAAPHNGFSNSKLSVQAFGQAIWLNAPNPLQ